MNKDEIKKTMQAVNKKHKIICKKCTKRDKQNSEKIQIELLKRQV